MNYSYNRDKENVVFASAKDINASFKDLCSVCDAVRYKQVNNALKVLDSVINEGKPIEYRRHNKYMGSRHELGGKKGRYPIKCAQEVRKVIVSAVANAQNKGHDADYMYVVHATANKTQIIPRAPPKGVRAVGGSRPSVRRSNIEFAKIEIGLAEKDTKDLGSRMKRAIAAISKREKPTLTKKAAPAKKPAQPKEMTKPLPAPEPAKPSEEKKTESKPVQEAETKQENKV